MLFPLSEWEKLPLPDSLLYELIRVTVIKKNVVKNEVLNMTIT